jgi:anthranilate synthase component 1
MLRKLARQSKQYYLLESVEGGERWGRYSFLGFNPVVRVTGKKDTVTVKGIDTKTIYTSKPMEVIRSVLAEYRSPKLKDMPPFTGGFVGYFSYDLIALTEPVLKLKESEFPTFDLMLFDKVIAYDHLRQKITVVVNMKAEDGEAGYRRAADEIEKIIQIITDPSPLPEEKADANPEFTCNLSKEEFCSMVEKAKQYIKDGDIFQVVPSRRFEAEYQSSLLNAYRVLRTTNPSPYMYFMDTGDLQITGASPETLIKLEQGRLTTYPVAGCQ